MAETPEPAARPFKKRKIFRIRARDGSDDEGEPSACKGITSPSTVDEDGNSDAQSSSLHLAKLRQQTRARKTGVGFGSKGALAPVRSPNSEQSISTEETTGSGNVAHHDAYSRFTKQVGQSGLRTQANDKHMLEYIDSKLAADRQAQQENEISQAAETRAHLAVQTLNGNVRNNQAVTQQSSGGGIGKIQEVDLGPDAALRNAQRTEAAARRMESGQAVVTDTVESGKSRKPRLGRDGKPWRPRKRRGSDDIQRDALVESILKENRIDIFSPPPAPGVNKVEAATGEAADERMAEEFRRNYLEQLEGRYKMPSKKPPGKVESQSKGPKMGGSRNARVQMAQQKAAMAAEKAGKRS